MPREEPIATPPRLIANRNFRRAWLGGAMAQTMRWLEMMVVAVFVFQLSGSPLQVAFILFLRMLPSFLFGAFTGVLAERFDRRRLLVGGLAVLAGLSTVLGLLVLSGQIRVWHVAIGVFVNGMFWSMDHPVRRTLLGDLAGTALLGRAIALDSSTANATRAAGPLIGGVVLGNIGMAGAYFIGAGLFAVAALLMSSVVYVQNMSMAPRGKVLANIRDGLVYIRSHRIIFGTLAVTLFMNFFGFPYVGMVPVIAKQRLGLDAFETGVLMSVEGAGAFLSALVMAWRLRPRDYTRAYFWGSVVFLSCLLMFSHATSFPTALGFLLVGGTGFAAFAAMQSTIVLATADPAFRARAMGVVAVCIGGGAPLGILHVGVLADWFGAPAAVSVIAAEGLIAMVFAAWRWPELLRPLASRVG